MWNGKDVLAFACNSFLTTVLSITVVREIMLRLSQQNMSNCAQSNALRSYLGLTTWTMLEPRRERSTRTRSRFVLSGNSWPTRFTKYRHRCVSRARAVCIHARMLCNTLGSPHVTLTCSHTYDLQSAIDFVRCTSTYARLCADTNNIIDFGSNEREKLELLFSSMVTGILLVITNF